MNFKDIGLEDKKTFDKYFSRYQPIASDYTFTNLFCWRKTRPISFAQAEGHLIIKVDEKTYYQPFGESPENMIRNLLKPGITFERVEKRIAQKLKGDFKVEPVREMFDYIYKIHDLVELSGREFAPKRNFINRCKKLEPKVLTCEEVNKDDCLALQERWCNLKECDNDPSVHAEDTAIKQLFTYSEDLDIHGIVVKIKGRVAGFLVGEKLSDETYVDHFEKGDTQYQGIYQFLLWEFCKRIPKGFRYINREQDLGVEGLRKAKLSYNPISLYEKFNISV